MSVIHFDIPKDTIATAGSEGIIATISIGGDTIFTATLIREPDDSLYYHIFDEADLDGDLAIDGHLPEYFDREVCGHIYDSYCGNCGLDSEGDK